MECPIETLNYKIVILPIEEEEKTYGTIIIPNGAQERPEIGKVMAVGPGRTTNEGITIKNKLKIGQSVIVPKFGAQVVAIENETYIVASENDILGVINKSKINKNEE